jgi:predicted DNA-binding protein (MmcQ/YjbR family)
MNEKDLCEYILRTYGVSDEYPFKNDFQTAVYRHADSRKWFAIVITVKKDRLYAGADGYITVVNVKCERELIPSLWQESGIFPAYHMNKGHWLSVCLDGSVDADTVKWLIGISHRLTK